MISRCTIPRRAHPTPRRPGFSDRCHSRQKNPGRRCDEYISAVPRRGGRRAKRHRFNFEFRDVTYFTFAKVRCPFARPGFLSLDDLVVPSVPLTAGTRLFDVVALVAPPVSTGVKSTSENPLLFRVIT